MAASTCFRKVTLHVLPSFFIVGPPRTGTSWLHEVLKKHVTLPTLTKETRFFDLHFHRGVWWYRAQFFGLGSSPIGEIAPTYFASHEARRRIKKLCPWAKIVCIFRNPVDRIVSLYRLKRGYAMVPWELDEALVCDRELVESSLYATYLREWFKDFGPDRVRPMFYDDLCDRPQFFVDQLADFLRIPRLTLTLSDLQVVHTSETLTYPRNYSCVRMAVSVSDWLKVRGLGKLVSVVKRSPIGGLVLGGGPAFPKTSANLSEAIVSLFRQEIEALEVMVNRDLSAWKQVEGNATPISRANAQVGCA